MKIIECRQGDPLWIQSRLGRPTASSFDRIVTPSGRPSGGQNKYLAELLAEWLYGVPASDYQSPAMERGSQEEKTAVAWYEWERGVTAEPVGLCLTDDGRAGASPDRMVAPDGCCEIKVPLAATVFLYWLDGRPEGHRVQRQGQLWVCERQWSDLVIYHPIAQVRRIIRDERDEKFIAALAEAVAGFCDRLDAAKAELADAKAELDARRSAAEAVEDEIPAELTP